MFHLNGVDALVLNAPTIAGIFDGKITRWNDPAIANLNRDVPLPDREIKPVHHTGVSSTTLFLSHYLASAAQTPGRTGRRGPCP
ncbi:substrate-binding domain-containing protein [Streptomyces sp. NPDC020681]|uniref:substrate-binding domain-containing protein n=1 Tax=Streptomyces sp. NPDC020681 TaxID=3365083 RepID=UPI00378A44C9